MITSVVAISTCEPHHTPAGVHDHPEYRRTNRPPRRLSTIAHDAEGEAAGSARRDKWTKTTARHRAEQGKHSWRITQ
jgi:hypothetical protein